jgi:hypothetical protein
MRGFTRGNSGQAIRWIRPVVSAGVDPSVEFVKIAEVVHEFGMTLDISAHPALAGKAAREVAVPIMVSGLRDIHRLDTPTAAIHEVNAHLLQAASAAGRQTIDAYFIEVERIPSDAVLNGMMEALEEAIQEEMIGRLGISDVGKSLATLGLWQFNDAFDFLLVDDNPGAWPATKGLMELATERRVSVIGKNRQHQRSNPEAILISKNAGLYSVATAHEARELLSFAVEAPA